MPKMPQLEPLYCIYTSIIVIFSSEHGLYTPGYQAECLPRHRSSLQAVIHVNHVTFTTKCGHHTPVVVSDMHDLNKLLRVDPKSKYLLHCRRLQPSHVGKQLRQEHLCCTDDLISEPPSWRQNNLMITMGQTIGTIIYPQFWYLISILRPRRKHNPIREQMGIWQFRHLTNAELRATLCHENLGACHKFSCGIGSTIGQWVELSSTK